MAIVRWQPRGTGVSNYRSAKDELECLLEDFFWGGQPAIQRAGNVSSTGPRVDLKDTDQAFVLRAEVPGLDKEDITLSIDKDIVTLKGAFGSEEATEGECFYCQERSAGEFERRITLPQAVAADKVEAALHNGVLTVTLPKAEPKAAVKISVN